MSRHLLLGQRNQLMQVNRAGAAKTEAEGRKQEQETKKPGQEAREERRGQGDIDKRQESRERMKVNRAGVAKTEAGAGNRDRRQRNGDRRH
jgi:hypothetical protein